MPAMSFVQKHPKTGVYRIRRRIPGRAQAAFGGKTEILETLNTKDVAEAKRLALPRLAELQAKIDRAMAGAIHWQMHDLDHADREFHQWMGEGQGFDSPTLYETRDEFLAEFAKFIEARYPLLSAPDADELRRHVETESDRLYPDTVQRPEPKAPKRHTLKQLEAKLLGQKSYTRRTVEDVTKAFASLRELNGDCDISRIGPDQIREWRDLLLAYPVKGRTKSLRLRDAAKQKWERTTNPKTVGKLLGFIRSGFKLAVSEGWANENPTRDIAIPKRTETSRDAPRVEYTQAQLTQLFTSPLFVGCRSESKLDEPGNVTIRDHRYWLPWLALYTGARLSELCALETSDLRRDGEIWYLHFTEQAEDESLQGKKRKKTKFSIRDVPLHRGLIKLGFVEFVQAQPKGLLFPTRHKDPETFARMFSKDYRGYLKKIGLKGVAMHSFRHGFASATRFAGIHGEDHNALAGRSQKGVGQQYGKQVRQMVLLAELIDRLEFPGVPAPK